ncbi:MAG: hypothetical protein K8I02_07430, partial [Candidatus Methylomirabilis sp.]|nr:hypothetical protein [Deltaproteobacteria bacterium]
DGAARLEAFRALLAFQMERIPAYGAWVRARRFEPERMTDWRDAPAVPTAAFKRVDLFAGEAEEIAHTFTTSGTTGAAKGRAHFSEAGLVLMRAAIEANAERFLFPRAERLRILVLAPPPERAPGMIMAWGMARLIEKYGEAGSGFLLDERGLDAEALARALREAEASGAPLCLIGASFAFVHLFDGFEARGVRFALPPGSRVMDAGGYKGRSREMTRPEFVERIERFLGAPPARAVNLLGMTELASQFYDDAMEEPPRAALKRNPPWTATAAIHPRTGAALPHGETGLLRHLDLANLDRPACIQTDDLGRTHPEGFEVFGRAADDGGRGCSLGVEELLGGAA